MIEATKKRAEIVRVKMRFHFNRALLNRAVSLAVANIAFAPNGSDQRPPMLLIELFPQVFHMASDHIGPQRLFVAPQPFF